MKKIRMSIIGILTIVFFAFLILIPKSNADDNAIVYFECKNLKKALNEELGKSADSDITIKDMHGLNGRLDLDSRDITSMKGLEHLINVSELLLNGNNISKIESLNTLTNLTWLELRRNKISKIEGLDNLTNLVYLYLENNEITKIEGLDKFTGSTELNLSNNQITKIEGLDNLTKLTKLDLEGNQISKIENLDKLTNLTSLSLGENKISKIEGLDKLTNLKTLFLYTNQISKIEGLDNLTSLDSVYLGKNKISKIEGLDKLTKLSYLSLEENTITKIEGLDNLTYLNNLDLENNQISKIEGLDKLTGLRELNLNGNKISKIEGLDNLTDLMKLYLEKNQISKMEGLDKVTNLRELNLNSNKIVKVERLDKNILFNKLDITNQVIDMDIKSSEFEIPKVMVSDYDVDVYASNSFRNNITKQEGNKYKIDDEGIKKLNQKREIFNWGVDSDLLGYDGEFSGRIIAISTIKEKDKFEEEIEKNKQVKVGENLDITTLLLNKPENARVEKVEDINTNTLGLKKGKIKVTFNDGSFKEIEVEVFVNAFDININYTNKNNEIIKSEVKTATINKETSKIEPDIMLENFDKELEIENKKYNAKYEIIGDKKLSINTDEYLNKDLTKEKIQKEVKVKTTLKIGNVEDDEKYRTHYKVTIDYKVNDELIKTEDVYVKKGEKLKPQDFEKDNKKYIIRNNDDREKEITKNIKLEISVIEQIKGTDLIIPQSTSIKITTKDVELKKGDDTTDTKVGIIIPEDNKNNVTNINLISKGERNKVGNTKDVYEITFKDGSKRKFEVPVKINKVNITINYKNKKDDVVKKETKEIKVGEKFIPEDFTKQDQTLGTIKYVPLDKTPVVIDDEKTLDIKVKAIINGKAIEDDEKYRTHYKVTIEYKNKAQNVVKTEEVYVKKGEKLKLQDFEKDNKKYIIRNNEDREKEITKNTKLEIAVIEQIKIVNLAESMASSIKITTNEVKIKKEDNTTDTKSGIVILEKDKKNVKEIVLISKGERKNLAKVKDKYKVVFVDGSSKAVEVTVNINSMDAGIIDGSKAKTTHYKVSVEYVDTKGKVIKTEEKLVKRGEKLELTGFSEKNKNYVISKSSSIEISKSGKIQVEVKESVKIGVIEEINGKDIQTQKVSIISGEDYDTKKAIKIPDALKYKIKNIELVSKLDRTRLGKGYDEYTVIFKDLSSRKVKVEVEILEKKKDIKLNPIEPNKVNTNRDKKNNRKIKKLPFSGSITNNALYASILLAIVGIIYRRKLANMKIKRTFRLKK